MLTLLVVGHTAVKSRWLYFSLGQRIPCGRSVLFEGWGRLGPPVNVKGDGMAIHCC